MNSYISLNRPRGLLRFVWLEIASLCVLSVKNSLNSILKKVAVPPTPWEQKPKFAAFYYKARLLRECFHVHFLLKPISHLVLQLFGGCWMNLDVEIRPHLLIVPRIVSYTIEMESSWSICNYF